MRKKYKTKFPVARIKKIMQMDEDVGKVAQATPILISKALELFMQSLIDEACIETRAKNAKRLTAAHLKKTILDKDQFDFLRDIVQNVPDPQAGSSSGAGAGEEASHSGSSGSGSGGGGGSSSNTHQNQGISNSSSSSSTKMEVDDDSDAAFAGAMAAARRGASRAAGPKKPVGRSSAKDDEDDDYDNE